MMTTREQRAIQAINDLIKHIENEDYQYLERETQNKHSGNIFYDYVNLVYAANCARNSITLCKPDQEAVRHKAELLCSYICLELGDGTTASEMSRRASEDSSSELFPAKIYAAQGLMLNNNYEEASKYLSRLVVESSFSKETDVNTLNFLTLAHVCLKMNDFKKAENQLTKAADSDSKRTELVLTNIWLDLQRKHPLQAIQEIKDYSETSDPSALDSQ